MNNLQSIYEYKTDNMYLKDKLYVLDCTKKSINFVMRLFTQKINFEGFFLTDNIQVNNTTLFNKPVISWGDLEKDKHIKFITSLEQYEYYEELLQSKNEEDRLLKIEVFNSSLISTENIITYGKGNTCKENIDLILKAGTNYFSDSYVPNDSSNLFYEKKELSIDEIKGMKDYAIIVASVFHEEIFNSLTNNGINNKRMFMLPGNDYTIDANYTIKAINIQNILQEIVNKNIVLYGYEEFNTSVINILKMCGIDLQRIRKVDRKQREENGTIFELIYILEREGVHIITDPFNDITAQCLNIMKADVKKTIWIDGYSAYCSVGGYKAYTYALDPSFAYAYDNCDEEFIMYTNSLSSDSLKILTLGGSTTDAHYISQKCWSEYLSEILSSKGVKHQIICGGIKGYTISQELIKLVRDGILMKPDIVISYSGNNNMGLYNHMAEYPFISTYQKSLFESIKENRKINYGIPVEMSKYEYWYMQCRIMNGICKELGIRFISILQPVLLSKKEGHNIDKNTAAKVGCFFDESLKKYICLSDDEDSKQRVIDVQEFRHNAGLNREEWFYDMSDIFDNIDGVYMDYCHLYESGNQIVARNIYDRCISRYVEK